MDNITVRHLSAVSPDRRFDVVREQELLCERDTVSTGGPESSYTPAGHKRFTMSELLRPLEATADLCRLDRAERLIRHAAPRSTPEELAEHSDRFRDLLSPVTATAAR